jgi:hypothetical protein
LQQQEFAMPDDKTPANTKVPPKGDPQNPLPVPDLGALIDKDKPTLLAPVQNFKEYALRFLTTGGQFIILGSLILILSYQKLATTHATFSFILVVLGSAILLYGTGTQGIGQFQGNVPNAAKYNVSIAGGAGVMALLIGYGMVNYEQEMRRIFQLESKHIILSVAPEDDASTTDDVVGEYFAEFSNSEGQQLAYRRIGNRFEVVVPFSSTGKDSQESILARVYRKNAAPGFKSEIPQVFALQLSPENVTLPQNGASFFRYKLDGKLQYVDREADEKNRSDAISLRDEVETSSLAPAKLDPALVTAE